MVLTKVVLALAAFYEHVPASFTDSAGDLELYGRQTGQTQKKKLNENMKKIKLLLGFIDANPVKDDTSVLFQQNTRSAVELLLEER